MPVLRTAKLSLLRTARTCGVLRIAGASRRRRDQLLILCYHGVSIDDEHEWAPGLYVSQAVFASRLAALKREGCTVVPLAEGIRRLYEGTLGPRSVAITFDDGNFDFHERAWPVLEAAGVPVTVYLTTYYCDNNLPIFPLAISYLLWKRQGLVVSVPVSADRQVTIDTRSSDARKRSQRRLMLHAQDEELSGDAKDELAQTLADALGADYSELKRRRMLHIMNPSEVRRLAAAGVDIQLHTHRHQSPLDRQQYLAEVAENRDRIAELTGRLPSHFCYPSGVSMPEFGPWLAEMGVESATTCEPGMATRNTDPMKLPRLLDHSEITDVEFEAWLSGVGAMLPHRPIGFQPVDRRGRLIIPREGVPDVTIDAGRTEAVPMPSEQHAGGVAT